MRIHHKALSTFLGLSHVFSVACGTADGPDSVGVLAELSVRAEPPGQMFAGRLQVSLLSSRPAQILYTLDGSDPSANSESGKAYGSMISLTEQTLLSFIAVSDDGSWSTRKTELYLKSDGNPPPTPAPRVLDLTADAIFFEAQPGQTDPIHKTVTLRSVGTEAVEMKSVRLQSNPNQSIFYDPDAFDIVGDVELKTLAPGESLVVEIMYIPSDTLRSDVLYIASDEQRHGGVQQVELWGRIADW